MKNSGREAAQNARIYSFDWLRIGAFVIVVLIHCVQMFGELYKTGSGGGIATMGDGATYALSFITQWCMALFFLLAGASTWLVLRRKTPRQFVQERFQRLLVPLIVGFVLLVPLQAYFEMLSNAQYSGSLGEFYPFFLSTILFHGQLQWITLYIHHLWFLAYLFGFSLISLPLCMYLRGKNGQAWIKRLADVCARPGGLLVLVLPIAIVQVALRAAFPVYCSLADVCCWLLFYMYGYMLFANPRLRQALRQQGRMALELGLAGCILLLMLGNAGLLHTWIFTPDYSVDCLLLQALFSLLLWTSVLVTLAAGDTYLNISCPFLKYGSAASFPWYILHFPVVLIAAYYILPLHWSVLSAFLCLFTGSLAITLLLSDLLLLKMRGLRGIYALRLRNMAVQSSDMQIARRTTLQLEHAVTGKLVG